MTVKIIAYRIIDFLTFGKGIKRTISGFSLRLPTRYFKYFPETYEKENFEFFKTFCKQDDIVIDIGAHIGLFAIRAAQLVGIKGKVYAFEPAPATFNLLQKTIALNGQEKVIKAILEAVTEIDGSSFFNVSDVEGDNSNSLVDYRRDKNLHKVQVRTSSIDSFLKREGVAKVKFIKIDAEGYEYGVLMGAKETFQKCRPFAIFALHPAGILANGDSLESIFDFIKGCNYKVQYNGEEVIKEEFCKKNSLFDVHLIPN